MARDPITQVIDWLWTRAEANTALAAMVKATSRIKLTGTDPVPGYKESLSDFPIVALTCGGVKPALGTTSGASQLDVDLTWQIGTDQMRLYNEDDAAVLQLIWELLQTLRTCQEATGLTPDPTGPSFSVRGVEVGSISIASEATDEEQQSGGWSAEIPLTVTIDVYASSMVPETP